MMNHRVVFAVVATVMFAVPAVADDWPQFRGPGRVSISQEKGLLKSWPTEGPKLLWQAKDVGFGYGSVAVAGGRVFLIGNRGMEEEFVAALDAKDGRLLWTTKLGKVGNPKQFPNVAGARSTPTVDGATLYALSSDGDLVSVEAATGKGRWRKNLRTDFGGKPGFWAYAESPLVDGNRVIVTPGGPGAALVALDKNNGATVWKAAVPGDDVAGYSSAVVGKIGEVRQVVAFIGKGLVGIEADTGKFLWRYDKTTDGMGANATTPIVGGDHVYSSSGTGGGLVLVKSKTTATTADPIYFAKKAPTALGGSVKVGDCLYGTTGASLLCTEYMTGQVKWSDRSIGAASILHADGRLYLHGENGEVALVEATPEGYRELGRFTPPDPPTRAVPSKAWNYPAISNGRLYLRDLGVLWVYDIRGPAQ
jgi:outer membrane protein assembly factor BamB